MFAEQNYRSYSPSHVTSFRWRKAARPNVKDQSAPMKIFNVSRFAIAVVVTTLLGFHPRLAQGGDQGFSKDVVENKSTETDLGVGKFATFPLHVSVTVRGGYDDNVNLSSFDEQGSLFTSGQLGLTYNFGSPRTILSLSAGGGVTYYFDGRDDDGFGSDNSDNFDVNGFIAFAVTHKATPRLTLAANTYATYQSRPDFQTFNFGTISFSRQSQNYFFTVNKFSLGYAWTPRFSTVSSYTLGYTDYDDRVVSRFQDRFEHTIGNEFRFLVWPTTSLIAEYRFGIVDYVEDSTRNSTSHFFLAGVDHSFSPRFNLSARGGIEVRSYDQSDLFGRSGDQTSPYGEFTLNYAIAQNTSVSWTNRYSIAESYLPELLNSTSYRTALALKHSFTPRISAGLNFAYENDDYDGNANANGFTEDAIDVLLWARYSINRTWSVDVGYNHTEVISGDALFRDYTRNRVYGGVTFTF